MEGWKFLILLASLSDSLPLYLSGYGGAGAVGRERLSIAWPCMLPMLLVAFVRLLDFRFRSGRREGVEGSGLL